MHSTKDQKIVDEGEADVVVHGGEVEGEEVAVGVVEEAAEAEESPMAATATRRLRISQQARKVRERRGSGLLSPMVVRTLVSGGMLLLHLSNPQKRRRRAKRLLHSDCRLIPFSRSERMFSKAHSNAHL
jgi:hypothetical protein